MGRGTGYRERQETYYSHASILSPPPPPTLLFFTLFMSQDHYPFAHSSSLRRDEEADSENGDHYSINSSTTRLAGTNPFLDYPGWLPFLFHPTSHPRPSPGDPSSDPYRQYNPSVDSHSSIPSISPFADPGLGSLDHYPAWSADRQIPMSAEEIEDIFLDLTQKFGFQRDSMRNMVPQSSTHI